jgi:hypothetical protein
VPRGAPVFRRFDGTRRAPELLIPATGLVEGNSGIDAAAARGVGDIESHAFEFDIGAASHPRGKCIIERSNP